MSSGPRDRFVSVNGIRLHYVDWGGEGPPAVLFHATGFHARVWDPIARALAGRFRVIALDARGHGDSDKPESGYDWSVFIDDGIAFFDELGLRGALGVGHSMGATAAAGVAAERPDLYERLVLLDMILVPREFRDLPGEQNPMVIAARKRRETWESRDAIFESYRGRPPFDTWREEILRLYVDHGTDPLPEGGVRLKCPARVEASIFGMASQFAGWSLLDRVSVPTLLVRGERSTTLSVHDTAVALGHLRRGRSTTAPGTTHLIPMERPEWVAEAIQEFCNSEEPRSTLPVPSRGLAHLALQVRSLEAACDFYREVFGMRVVWQPDPDNVYLSSGRDNLALHRAADGITPLPGALDHLGFLVDRPSEVYAAAEALRSRGIPLRHPPRHHRDGSCSLYLEDPDGNLVQILYTPDAPGD